MINNAARVLKKNAVLSPLRKIKTSTNTNKTEIGIMSFFLFLNIIKSQTQKNWK